jgi:gluconate 5-dehydrogenase
MQSKGFVGKRVLITGSSRGLGNTYAMAFMEKGAAVVLHGKNPEKLEKAIYQAEKKGYSAESCCFDVTDRDAVIEAIDKIETENGPIDILINNAGINIRSPFLEMKPEDFDKVLRTNLYSAFFVGQAVARYMAKRKRGKIINVCSLLSEVARPGIPAYTVSKGGVKMLTKAMAVDLAPYNIQVNGIGPGYFDTEMNTALVKDKRFDTWLKDRTPQSRWGHTEELREAIFMFASDASSFTTGQILYIDGGILATL